MEKYSAYRDPGTGIQPFLTPLSPAESDIFTTATLPFRYLLGIIRTALVLFVSLVYFLSWSLCLVFYLASPVYRIVNDITARVFGRMVLLILGFIWISTEPFYRKRGRGPKLPEKWEPKRGDIIVSNWVSWVEILWLTSKFNPIFVVPIPESLPTHVQSHKTITRTPGRQTGTGSANVQSLSRTQPPRIPIRGFRQVSFLRMITLTGFVPPFKNPLSVKTLTLEEIRKSSSRPLVVFPECTSSNGRGLLRFASVFRQNVPVKNYQVFVMNVRYDHPKPLAPTLSHSLPSGLLSPIPHMFSVASSLLPAQITISLLAPSESPASQLLMVSEVLPDYKGDDQLSETCAVLIAQMGKIKRTGMGWEDKSLFLDFYNSKEHI